MQVEGARFVSRAQELFSQAYCVVLGRRVRFSSKESLVGARVARIPRDTSFEFLGDIALRRFGSIVTSGGRYSDTGGYRDAIDVLVGLRGRGSPLRDLWSFGVLGTRSDDAPAPIGRDFVVVLRH